MAQESDTRYRVETLVLTLIEPQAPPQPVAELRSYDDAVDLSARAQEQRERVAARIFRFSLGDATLVPPPPLHLSAEIEGPWAKIDLLENRSERMSQVWRNLRLSAEYRPEAFIAWEQPADPPFPLLRIHNASVLKLDDPWQQVRGAAPPLAVEPESEAEEVLPGEAMPRDVVFLYDLEYGSFNLVPVPNPAFHYELEGTVRLRRTRFLHIDLDLQLRTPAPATRAEIPGPPLLPRYQGYLVHELVQSRQIRTDRMEYFDSPSIGVLVWVTEIKSNEEESAE